MREKVTDRGEHREQRRGGLQRGGEKKNGLKRGGEGRKRKVERQVLEEMEKDGDVKRERKER